MPTLTFVYAGTRQPLPAGTRVYGLELESDGKGVNAPPFKTDVGANGAGGTFAALGYPAKYTGDVSTFAPKDGILYQVIAIPAAQDFGTPQEAYAALRRCPPIKFAEQRMGAVMLPGLRPDQSAAPHAGGHAVRFRAIAKDGEELVSSALALGDSGEGPHLSMARIGEARARCGALLTLKVFARGLDGQTVRFELESGDGKAWKPAGAASAQVKDGAAVAQIVLGQLVPPAKSVAEQAKPAGKLRVHAIADFERLASAPVDLLPPAYAPPPAKDAPPKK